MCTLKFVLVVCIALWSAPFGAVGDFIRPFSRAARNAFDRVTLPFPYSQLPSETARQTAFVYENFYTVLHDDAQKIEKKYAIVGTLMPCFFIGLRSDKQQKSIVFHKTSGSSLDSLVDVTRKELALNKEDEKFLKGYLFSNWFPLGDDFSIDGRKDFHQGRTHAEEMNFIRDFLIKSLGVSKEKIECQLFKNRFKRFAALSVLADSELRLNSICLVREEIFSESSQVVTRENTSTEMERRTLELWSIYFNSFNGVKPPYNSIPFAKAPLHYFDS